MPRLPKVSSLVGAMDLLADKAFQKIPSHKSHQCSFITDTSFLITTFSLQIFPYSELGGGTEGSLNNQCLSMSNSVK